MTNQKTRNMNSRNSPNILRGVSSKKKKIHRLETPLEKEVETQETTQGNETRET